jgi:hypothetical protein
VSFDVVDDDLLDDDIYISIWFKEMRQRKKIRTNSFICEKL